MVLLLGHVQVLQLDHRAVLVLDQDGVEQLLLDWCDLGLPDQGWESGLAGVVQRLGLAEQLRLLPLRLLDLELQGFALSLKLGALYLEAKNLELLLIQLLAVIHQLLDRLELPLEVPVDLVSDVGCLGSVSWLHLVDVVQLVLQLTDLTPQLFNDLLVSLASLVGLHEGLELLCAVGILQGAQVLLLVGRNGGHVRDHDRSAVSTKGVLQKAGQLRVSVGHEVVDIVLRVVVQHVDTVSEGQQGLVDVATLHLSDS